MLKLKNITKDYTAGGETVRALKGINIEFRENEFVSILGQSGCGKTTLLNIIGGLDKYTSRRFSNKSENLLKTIKIETGIHTVIIQLVLYFKAII